MPGQAVLAYWFNLAPNSFDEWADWYLRDHMPSRIDSGFLAAKCYRAADGGRSMFLFFEAATAEELMTPDYLAKLKQVSPDDKRRRAFYLDTVRATCRVRATIGRAGGGVCATVRFTIDPARAVETGRALEQTLMPDLARTERVGAVHLWQMDRDIRAAMDAVRVTGHADGYADWIVAIETVTEEDAAAARDRLYLHPLFKALGTAAEPQYDCYRLLYGMVR